jgi:dTDP-glucose 4,6-dehydratase
MCDRHLAEGHTVVAVDNFLTGSPRNLAHLEGHNRFRFVEQDMTP